MMNFHVGKKILQFLPPTFRQQRQFSISEANIGYNFKNRRREIEWNEEKQLVMSVASQVKQEILEDQLLYGLDRPQLRARFSHLLDYTTKLNPICYASAYTTVHAYRFLEKPSKLTDDNLKKASILGWCMRLNEASMVVVDDIFDNSDLRYNKPPWYKVVGREVAVTDAIFLGTSVYYILLRHFSKHPQFSNILRELVRNLSTTTISAMLDMQTYKIEEFEANENVMKAYAFTVTPVLSAMYLANIDDPQLHSMAFEICADICIFTKREDDVESAFENIIDKDNTDIAENRTTWLAIQVHKFGTPEQKKILEDNHGKGDKEAVARVYKVYNEMQLQDAFKKHTEEFYETTLNKIQALPKELPKQLFIDILDFAVLHQYRS